MDLRAWVTLRGPTKREWAADLGADAVFETGRIPPEPVNRVIETVVTATWQHSLDSVGRRIVVSGITTCAMLSADLLAVLAKGVTVQGSVMGTGEDPALLAAFVERRGRRRLCTGYFA